MDSRRIILTLCVALTALVARAQFDTHFTHYWALQGYYNPAVAGLSGRLNLYGTYAMQMAGYTHAPATMLFGADMVLPTEKKNQAVSANLYNESIGLFTNQRLFAGYAYRFKLWDGRMAVGINAGSLEQKFDGSKVEAEESTDAAFPSSESLISVPRPAILVAMVTVPFSPACLTTSASRACCLALRT